MTVRIYVDWSGDPGFRFRRGSSTLFLVAAITAQDQEINLAPLRAKMMLPENYEFHFSKSNDQIRAQFYDYLRIQPDFLAAVVLRVDKRLLGPDFRQMRGEQIIAGFIAACIQHFPAPFLKNSITPFNKFTWLVGDAFMQAFGTCNPTRACARLRQVTKQ